MAGLKAWALFIDPQNDFTDNPHIPGSLAVPGAMGDMDRMATFIAKYGARLDGMQVTLDSHHRLHIANPGFWADSNGKIPAPFTQITEEDVRKGRWSPRRDVSPDRAQFKTGRDYALHYVKMLKQVGNKDLTIWPEHCLIGTAGHAVSPTLNEALQNWALDQFATIDYVTKGSCVFTEHFGALQAEVPLANDPGTQFNTDFVKMLAGNDVIFVGGEASSHCVMSTVNQIADNIGDEHLGKIHLVRDWMSPVPAIPNVVDFPAIADAWLKNMERRGLRVISSKDIAL